MPWMVQVMWNRRPITTVVRAGIQRRFSQFSQPCTVRPVAAAATPVGLGRPALGVGPFGQSEAV